MAYKFFTAKEAEGLNPELMSKLDTARAVAGVPFVITSGLRTCATNKAALGVEHSSHLGGKAVDLAVDSGSSRFAIVRGLMASGFVRIGAYDKHIHADVDESLPQNVFWVGTSH